MVAKIKNHAIATLVNVMFDIVAYPRHGGGGCSNGDHVLNMVPTKK